MIHEKTGARDLAPADLPRTTLPSAALPPADAGAPLTYRALNRDGACLRYFLRAGTDPRAWALFIHGAGTDHRSFERQLALFDSRYNILLPDLSGQGLSTLPPGSVPTFEGVLGDLICLCERHGLRDAVVLAHSFGAAVAQELALRRPEMVSRLVLIGGYNHHRSVRRSVLSHHLRIAVTHLALRVMPWPVLSRWFARMSSADPATIAYTDMCLRRTGWRAWESLGTTAFAGMHEVDGYPRPHPTLVLRGEHDNPAVFASIDAEMARTLPDCRVTLLPGAGHSCHEDAPDAANQAIRDFLAATAADPA